MCIRPFFMGGNMSEGIQRTIEKRCSFCMKRKSQVKKLMQSNTTDKCICDGCATKFKEWMDASDRMDELFDSHYELHENETKTQGELA